jgi:hypothetical protein
MALCRKIEEKQKKYDYRSKMLNTKEEEVDMKGMQMKMFKQKETLRSRIDKVFPIMNIEAKVSSVDNAASFTIKFQKIYEKATQMCRGIVESKSFNILIVAVILFAGIEVAVTTDSEARCERVQFETFQKGVHRKNICGRSITLFSTYSENICLALFTVEFLIKVVANGRKPWKYLTDEEVGAWNRLDLFIIIFGFLMLTPLQSALTIIPVLMLLRLIRLLRVLRLARAFPRLRAIVESLINCISSVFFLMMIIIIHNYTAAVLCSIYFKLSDPFHWSSLLKSFMTMLSFQTLDNWGSELDAGAYFNFFYTPSAGGGRS